LLCSSNNPSYLIGKLKVFLSEEVDLSFMPETKEHIQISRPSFWKKDSETVFLGTHPDFKASFWKRDSETVFLPMF